jgi:hypothetical protein
MKNSIRLTIITLLLAASNLSADTHYVARTSAHPTSPYTNSATAATNIQQAVDVAEAGDLIHVAGGKYPGGLVVHTPVWVQGFGLGLLRTTIDGGGVLRCVSLTDGATLSGFTLTNGACEGNGAGVVCTSTNAVLTNCTVAGNVARASGGLPGDGGYGGGAYGGTLYNCTLSGNTAVLVGTWGYGGGAYGSTLYDCTLTGNMAGRGGGAYGCTLSNCTLTDNDANKGQGGGACLSTLYNCTLSYNWADVRGGGASSCTLYNCTLIGNGAQGYPWSGMHLDGYGGGASGCTLYNCTLTGNHCSGVPPDCTGYGGGASESTLKNCTLSGNSAPNGGGAYGGTLYNCIVYFNTATNGPEYLDSTLNDCWTASDPLFVGNLRLQSNSPCVNAGNNAYVTTSTDLDGRPRIISGTVDIGAYEFQGPFDQWLQQYGLSTDGSADYTDPDHDRMNNWQEWVCGTCPTNSLSALCLLSAVPTGSNVTLSWQSAGGVSYFLKRSADLASAFAVVATNILGQAGTTSYSDTNATGPGPFFYRLGVAAP